MAAMPFLGLGLTNHSRLPLVLKARGSARGPTNLTIRLLLSCPHNPPPACISPATSKEPGAQRSAAPVAKLAPSALQVEAVRFCTTPLAVVGHRCEQRGRGGRCLRRITSLPARQLRDSGAPTLRTNQRSGSAQTKRSDCGEGGEAV